jgi:prepilin-type processing-associated H-X9-DG protein
MHPESLSGSGIVPGWVVQETRSEEEGAMSIRRRRGLALIELVTGTGVILVLVALQLPGLQQARESARRSQCVNNMKQMGLALHNYHSANDSFPMSAVAGPGHGTGHSGFMLVMPYMEQTAVYNAYNFSLENWHVANKTSTSVKLAVYLCPSNPDTEPTPASEIRTHEDKPYPGRSTFGAGHYGMNWGGVRAASGAEVAKAYPMANYNGPTHLGVLLTVVESDGKGGNTKNIGIRNITDGTSFTLAVVEKRDSFGWAVGGWGGSEFDVNTSLLYEGDDAKLKRVFTGSLHPGGVNAAFCDGSVKFLKPTVDQKTWYALTTRSMGEIIPAAKLNP